MELIADILMSSGAFGAGIYCYVLAARLKRFRKPGKRNIQISFENLALNRWVGQAIVLPQQR